jgi:hypothetical protein
MSIPRARGTKENFWAQGFDARREKCDLTDPFCAWEEVVLDLRRRPEDVQVTVPDRLPKGFSPAG